MSVDRLFAGFGIAIGNYPVPEIAKGLGKIFVDPARVGMHNAFLGRM
jgi:hypothetical protein